MTRKRPTSARKAEANRRNARKSKGPRTPEGKLRVRLSALKHGVHSDPLVRGMLSIGESPQAHYRLLAQLHAHSRLPTLTSACRSTTSPACAGRRPGSSALAWG